MRVLLLKFCEYASKQENGRQTMVGMFDDIRLPQLPIDHPPFFLCCQLEFEKKETGIKHRLEFRLLDPAGEVGMQIEAPIELPKEEQDVEPRLFLVVGISGIRVQKAGTYLIQALADGDILASEPLPVRIIRSPNP